MEIDATVESVLAVVETHHGLVVNWAEAKPASWLGLERDSRKNLLGQSTDQAVKRLYNLQESGVRGQGSGIRDQGSGIRKNGGLSLL